MLDIEPLASELRRELGVPPEAWVQGQRARLRRALREPLRRRLPRAALPFAAALLVGVGVLVWAGVPRSIAPVPSVDDTWLIAEELEGPHRFPDGSSVSLGPLGRGRLLVSDDAVRFDLHAGRATFDVRPKQPRPWIVSAGRNQVHVVGTRFSVLYGSGETFEVQVEQGVVSVRVPDRGSRIQLQAGDRLERRSGRMAIEHGAATAPASARPVAPTGPVTPAPRSAESAANAASALPASPGDWQESYRRGKYTVSLQQARGVGVNKLIAELPSKGLAELADAARFGGDTELAVRALTALQERFPSSDEAREARFLLGRMHALRGNTSAAIAAFEGYLAQRGASPYATEATGRLMELHSERGDIERARAMAERYLEQAPNGPYKRLASSLLGRPR